MKCCCGQGWRPRRARSLSGHWSCRRPQGWSRRPEHGRAVAAVCRGVDSQCHRCAGGDLDRSGWGMARSFVSIAALALMVTALLRPCPLGALMSGPPTTRTRAASGSWSRHSTGHHRFFHRLHLPGTVLRGAGQRQPGGGNHLDGSKCRHQRRCPLRRPPAERHRSSEHGARGRDPSTAAFALARRESSGRRRG